MVDPIQTSAKGIVKKLKAGLKPSVFPPGHPVFRPLELHELRNHTEMKWLPCYFLNTAAGEVSAIGYRSKTERGQGWIGLRENVDTRIMSESPSREEIQGIMSQLHSDGVRVVSTEVDAVKKAKQPFIDAGFDSLCTLYEMELVLAY
jgi:hypothetical protein